MNDKNKINNNPLLKIFKIVLRIILFPFVLIWLVSNSIKKHKQKRANAEKIRIFEITQIDSLSGVEFEMVLKQLFEKQGFDVKLTKKSGDFGADLICTKNKITTIVQAKCYHGVVGPRAIQEIVGAKSHYKSMDAMVVTNNYFSKEATILASENNVKLIDRDGLKSLLSKVEIYFSRTKFGYSCLNSTEISKIESRFKFWI